MRFPAGKTVVCYSHTDDQVRFIARFCLLLGGMMGGVVTGVIMSIANGR